MPQFIYTMKGLGKVHPPDTRVLDDIWLSFYYGAKIGVLGLNGAGKSSLLKIMAGEDTSFIGEAFAADGISIGFLHQEPRLDGSKTVLGNVEEGVDRAAPAQGAGHRLQHEERGHSAPGQQDAGPAGEASPSGAGRRVGHGGPYAGHPGAVPLLFRSRAAPP